MYIPSFKSTIPAMLLEDKSDDWKFVYNSMDVTRQQNDAILNAQAQNRSFLMAGRIKQEEQALDVTQLKEFKDKITSLRSKWIAGGLFAAPIILYAVWDIVKSKVFHI